MSRSAGSACASGKVRHRDRIAALLALASTTQGSSARDESRAYRCPLCSGWHLTSKKAYAAPSMGGPRARRPYRVPQIATERLVADTEPDPDESAPGHG